MRNRLQDRAVRATVMVVSMLLWTTPGTAQSEAGISAFVGPDGRVVFTNMATAPSIASSPSVATIAPAIPASRPAAGWTTPYDNLINAISARYGVNPALVRAVIEVESNFDRDAVSAKGAQGLMQLIPETGARFGVRDPFDPTENIEGGVRYLRFLLEMFEGNLDLSLAAYNSGENRVARLGRVPQIRETQDYVRKVRAAFERMGGAASRLQVASETAAPAADRVARQSSPRGSGAGGGSGASGERVISSTVNEAGVLSFTNLDSYR